MCREKTARQHASPVQYEGPAQPAGPSMTPNNRYAAIDSVAAVSDMLHSLPTSFSFQGKRKRLPNAQQCQECTCSRNTWRVCVPPLSHAAAALHLLSSLAGCKIQFLQMQGEGWTDHSGRRHHPGQRRIGTHVGPHWYFEMSCCARWSCSLLMVVAHAGCVAELSSPMICFGSSTALCEGASHSSEHSQPSSVVLRC